MNDTGNVGPPPLLSGTHVRLEPLSSGHVAGLVAAAAQDPALYDWSAVPQGEGAMRAYVDAALAERAAGTTLPFATLRAADGVVLGSTRFFLIERWAWPAGHSNAAPGRVDGCEIGYTWLGRAGVRTAANTEAKLLMLAHAFEAWDAYRVCFHTDVRNERSRNALARIGAQFEGVLRAHRLATDATPRDSARFSITRAEWPGVKRRLQQLMTRREA
ncbi:MAG TPA: GNAT family protein [Steroidobacteraceae bacterium]|nr:GNAT family protein [Steroidobacteraceae bacterium]